MVSEVNKSGLILFNMKNYTNNFNRVNMKQKAMLR